MIELSEVDLKVINGLLNAVEDRGTDWVYPMEWRDAGACVNLRPDGTAACIIGYIAVDQKLETTTTNDAAQDAARWGVSAAIENAMAKAQAIQDEDLPWGDAASRFFHRLFDLGITLEQLATYGIDVSRLDKLNLKYHKNGWG